MAYAAREVVASAARTTSGDSGALTVGGGPTFAEGVLSQRDAAAVDTIALAVRVTATSGTPSMVVSVEWSLDGSNFVASDPADAFTAPFTATGSKVRLFDAKASTYRIVWTITGGTPSLTFTVHESANAD